VETQCVTSTQTWLGDRLHTPKAMTVLRGNLLLCHPLLSLSLPMLRHCLSTIF
jgi:hypothetical protein